MRNFLIFLGIVLVITPFVIILQPVMGWNLVTIREYFIMVIFFVALLLLYEKEEKKTDQKND